MIGFCCCLGIIIILIIAVLLYYCLNRKSLNNQFLFNKNLFTNDHTSPNVRLMQRALGIENAGTIPSQMNNPTHTQISNKIVALQGKPIDKNLYNILTSNTKSPSTNISSPIAAGIRNAAAAAKASNTAVYGKISDGNSMMIPTEKIAAAEQELWMANRLSAGQVSLDNLNYAGLDNLNTNTNIDYESYLDNMVIDERLTKNHSNWVNEMLPWSGTAQTVDNIDEALTNSLPFVGFSRPQAIAQDPSALFQTEIGAADLIGNYNPFNKINN
jgi:hypothetical protein